MAITATNNRRLKPVKREAALRITVRTSNDNWDSIIAHSVGSKTLNWYAQHQHIAKGADQPVTPLPELAQERVFWAEVGTFILSRCHAAKSSFLTPKRKTIASGAAMRYTVAC